MTFSEFTDAVSENKCFKLNDFIVRVSDYSITSESMGVSFGLKKLFITQVYVTFEILGVKGESEINLIGVSLETFINHWLPKLSLVE